MSRARGFTTSRACSPIRAPGCHGTTCRSSSACSWAQEFGTAKQKQKRSLILDQERWRYQQFCSDIAGQDICAHGNEPAQAIAAVRAMLATAMGGTSRVPGPAAMCDRYQSFCRELPLLRGALSIPPSEPQFVELRSLMNAWLNRHTPLD